MTPMKLRRLAADFERVSATFSQNPYIRVVEVSGKPAERYVFEIRVPGLVPVEGQRPQPGEVHRAEVFLPADYPRRPPLCRMLTPVFHPNIDPAKICIGDHWSAGQSLAHLVVRIAEMICFQSFNTQSPLNAEAAAWAEQHASGLPLVRTDLSIGL